MGRDTSGWLPIAVLGLGVILSIGVCWKRTWDKFWEAVCELLKNWKGKS